MSQQAAVVLGAGGDLGAECVSLLLSDGWTVIAVDHDSESLEKLATRVSSQNMVLACCDAGSPESLAIALSDSGHIDELAAVIYCAGILVPGDGDVLEGDPSVWAGAVDANLLPFLYAARTLAPILVRNGGGSFVAVASIAALRGSAVSQLGYTASKGGIVAAAREMAVSLAKYSVRVNCVCPGIFSTPLSAPLISNPTDRARRVAGVPMGRFGQASEVAEVVVWLASNASSYLTGAEIPVDGGASACFFT